MSTFRKRSGSGWLNPIAAWRRLPINWKLLLPVLFTFAILVAVFAAFVMPAFTSLIEDNVRLGFNAQIDRLNARILEFFADSQRTIVSLAHGSETQRFAALYAAGSDDEALNLTRSALENVLAAAIAVPKIPFADLRFLSADGDQLIAVRAASGQPGSMGQPVDRALLESESASPLYGNVRRLSEGEFYISSPLLGTSTGQAGARSELEFQVGSPVFVDGQLVGMIVGSLRPRDYLLSAFQPGESELSTFASVLLDQAGNPLVVVDASAQPPVTILGDANFRLPALPPELLTGPDQRLVNIEERTYSTLSFRSLETDGFRNAGWRLIVSKAADDVSIAGANELIDTATSRLILLLIGIVVFIGLVGQSIAQPIRRVSAAARRIAAGDLQTNIPVRGRDEVGQLAGALDDMRVRLYELITSLEERVTERTRNIQVAADIGRETARLRDINELLQYVVNAIRARFNLYHAQIFLIDEAQENAVLVIGTGDAGKELLARKHKLAIGSNSVVGQTAARLRPFITLDTQQSEVPHRYNPVLPLTRSEMALPLSVGEKLVGVLDVQSVEPNAFDLDDVQIFQLLADQLAIAIDNARLLAEQQTRVEQINALNRLLTRTAWTEYVKESAQGELAYAYDLVDLKPVEIGPNGHGDDATTVEAGIIVRGQQVGSLSVQESEHVPLSSEDRAVVQAVADRVALVIENIRLIEQTQHALSRVEQLYESSRALGSATALGDIYRLAAEQLARFGPAEQVIVLLAAPAPNFYAPFFQHAYTWQRVPGSPNPFREARRLPREVLPEIWLGGGTRTPHLADLRADLTDLPGTQRVFEALSVQSLITVPLATPARWFGLMLCESRQTNAFSPNYVQFASAIADQVSIALENRFLFDEAQAEARRNRALAEAAQIASQIGVNFETGVENLLQAIAPSANYDRWWFGRVNLAVRGVVLERITARFAPGSPLESMLTVTLEIDRNALAEATRIGELVLVNDPGTHPAVSELPPNIAQAFGKHMALPIRVGLNTVAALLVGRDAAGPDMDERDIQLVTTLANQIAIVYENQRLFNVAQSEREVLQSVLNSLPTGVIVVDAETEQIALRNEQARLLLGLDELVPYELVRTSIDTPYDEDELPQVRVLRTQEPIYAEDVTVIDASGNRTDLLVNAVPIFRAGRLLSAVAVYQDVTELRELENVLQESLRETTTLYEISRSIAVEHELPSILHVVAEQLLNLIVPDHIFVIFTDNLGKPAQSFAVSLAAEQIEIAPSEATCPVPVSVLRTDEMFILGDIGQNPDLAGDPQLMALGIVSLSVFPLNARSRTVGWLVIGFKAQRTFTPEERRMLSNIADQTAVAAESARLAEQTAQALTTTTQLYEASLSINQADSLETTLEAMRDQLRYFEPAQIDIFLVNPRSEERQVDWVVHWDAADPTTHRSVELVERPTFGHWQFIEAAPQFIENAFTADPARLALLQALPDYENIGAHASVPLAVKGRVMGRLSVNFAQPHKFGRAEEQIISALADQGAIALDNFLLVQQTQDSLDETATLYQSSRAIADAADMHEQLAAIIDYAVLPIVTGAFLIRLLTPRWDAPDASIEIVASWRRGDEGVDLTGIRFTPEQFPAWREIASGDVIWIEDITDQVESARENESIYHILGFRSVLVFPLSSAGRPIGALLFGAGDPWPRTDREMRIYTSLADLIAVAMERQHLLEQTEERARQLQLSAQIAQAAISILNLDELFDRTVNLIKEGFNYDHVQIFLIEPDGRHARVVASTGEIGRQLIEIGHKLKIGSRSVVGQVTSTGLPQIVSDTTDQRSVHRPNPYLPQTRAEMALPLIARNRILGALDVQSNEPGAFTSEDVSVLSTLADQIAIAINNAELFETANARAEEMRFLFDATRAATVITQEPEAAIQQVAQLVLERIDAAATSLILLDDTETRLIPSTVALPGVEVSLPAYFDYNSPFFRSFATEKEPMIVNDVSAFSRLVQTSPKLGQLRLLQQLQGLLPDAGSILLLPLVSGEEFVGMLVAAKPIRDGFDDDTLRLVQTLSSTLAAIIQNARLLREVQAANIRLMELDKVKNQFLANMSHELRTPLNSIIGFSRVILKGIDGPLTEMQEQDLTTIYESGKHLLGLVNDILDQAKIEADRMEFSYSHFSMTEVIRGVMSTAVGLVKDKPIRLYQELDPELPPVWGDEFRTRQALLNLVSNAAKFTEQGSITVTAFATEEEGQPFVQISVADTGIGIPPDRLDSIFEPFQQVENSAARQYEGTGLGLPIAQKLIAKQGGRMWVTSELGVGSTFYFTMPVNPTEGQDESEDEAQTQSVE